MNMKTVKLFIFGGATFCIIQACNNNSNTSTEKQGSKWPEVSFELYKDDTINLNIDGIKQGHWIIFENSIQNNTAYTKSAPTHSEEDQQPKSLTGLGSPLEEGYYKDGKKQGFWKYYNVDGNLKDSVEYKDDQVVLK
jgi:antitoxin component YwqK of YwqJK toxin-antitoxin module